MNKKKKELLDRILNASQEQRKTFDWDEAAKRIKQTMPKIAAAGLTEDWPWTAGVIWTDGKPVFDEYTWLSSTWATPVLSMDGVEQECWVPGDQTQWDHETKWPKSALDIIHS